MDGRIVSRDVLEATPIATPTTMAPGSEFTDIDLTSMRKACTVAKNLSLPNHMVLTLKKMTDKASADSHQAYHLHAI